MIDTRSLLLLILMSPLLIPALTILAILGVGACIAEGIMTLRENRQCLR